MKLYHCPNARSMRCLWALEELGLHYELITLQFPPRVFDKSYKSINPLGTVPCLIDGDTKMTESAGICEYLGVRYGPTPLAVTPEEPEYGDYLNWLHRSDATLLFPQTLVFRYSALEPEERRQPQVVEDYKKWFLGRWRSVEEVLETRDYLCTERFTMADICVGYALHFANVLGIAEAMTPNVKKWWKRLSERPAFQRASG
ncbi:glutathione S-transferase family protein [Hyphococcus flavus]|uniref:Glutathione S-transferase family protein n=1 Tax=Hyphococcus flavus TaxID=1866326 RepID=A0AAE9ZEM1_9PROT|nr:glutathione S-transferase family protein [Hyphococcus flavus]WDI31702.1 glutathione S-transferase family protein [Hyphococcus flavus]